MNVQRLVLPLISILLVMGACAQEEKKSTTTPADVTIKKNRVANKRHHEPHRYGGWYCPDNLFGFPPVNIGELENIRAISNRLPTKEETQTEASLIFIDTDKYPDAMALDIDLPQLATIYSENSKMEELVVVIQAVIIDEDTIVGYRFPSGGNGSAWYDEVSFLTDQERKGLESSPYVFEKAKINADTKRIWQVISATAYARNLAVKFDQEPFFASEWTYRSMARLDYETIGEKATGIVANVFGSLYLQIDYDYNGFHFTEKILVLEDEESGTSEVLLVFGPYRENYEAYKSDWQTWLAELTAESEGE